MGARGGHLESGEAQIMGSPPGDVEFRPVGAGFGNLGGSPVHQLLPWGQFCWCWCQPSLLEEEAWRALRGVKVQEHKGEYSPVVVVVVVYIHSFSG